MKFYIYNGTDGDKTKNKAEITSLINFLSSLQEDTFKSSKEDFCPGVIFYYFHDLYFS